MTNTQTAPLYTADAPMDNEPRETIYASFVDAAHAEKAAGALLDFGVRSEDISLVSRGAQSDENVAPRAASERSLEAWNNEDTDTGYSVARSPFAENGHSADADGEAKVSAKSGISTTTPGDAASGAAKGAGIGLGVGIAAALAAIFVPGFGLVAGGGALAIALGGAAGATAAGAVAGGVTGYLKDQGVPDDVAARYTAAYNAGGAILAIAVPSNKVDKQTACDIMAKYGSNGAYGVTHRSPATNRY